MLHIITPFSRIENKEFYIENYKGKNIIWHPITAYSSIFKWEVFDNPNIQPLVSSNILEMESNKYNPSTLKINYFIKNYPIINDDYYGFIFDDDWMKEDLPEKLNKYNDDVIFVSMKRGYQIPEGAPGHGTETLIPFKGVGCGQIGFQQIFIKGHILKQMEFFGDREDIRSGMPDGHMAVWLQENFEVKYVTNLYVLFNYLEEGRWTKFEEKIIMETLQQRFERVKNERRDINEHLDTLLDYAKKCDVIVELGANEGISTTAFAYANSKEFYSYDYIGPNPMLQELIDICEKEEVNLEFTLADSREIEIPECDLLFIDTLHIYDQLAEELKLHANKAKKYILIHDTETFKTKGVVEGTEGLWKAVEEFLEENPQWQIKRHYTNNNGLTVLEKRASSKKYLLATSAFSNCDLLYNCIKSWPERSDSIDKVVFLDGKNWEADFKDILQEDKIGRYVDYYFSANEHVGASGGWNKILEYGFVKNDYDVVIIMGADTEMKEGFFDLLIKEWEENNPDFSCCMGFNCITMTRKCFDTVGTFDENFFPAYFEDNDYDRRVRLAKETILYKNVGDETLLEHYGSSTIRRDSFFNTANGKTFSMNQKYNIAKWGCTPQDPSACTFETPFNDPTLTFKDWTLNKEEKEIKRKIWEKKQ